MHCFLHATRLKVRTVVLAMLAALILSLASSSTAAADTIVLKNGRRIVALTAVEEGDKVRYQTAAGGPTPPKSIVDHIEKGGAVATPDSRETAAAKMEITPPTMEASAEIEKAAVHDGGIDRNYVARVEGETRSGDAAANAKAARAL